jgi:ketosteroid isomerase-like protein
MRSENETLVEDYIRRYNLKDIDGMMTLFSEDVLFESISAATGIMSVQGKENLRQLAQKSAEIFKVRRQTPSNVVLDGNKAAVEVNYWAVLAMDLPDGKKEGEEVQFRGVSFFEIREGLISRLTDYM